LGWETPTILAELLGMRILLPKWAAAPKSMLKGCNPDRTHDCWWWWLLKFLRTISAKLLQRKSHKIYVYISKSPAGKRSVNLLHISRIQNDQNVPETQDVLSVTAECMGAAEIPSGILWSHPLGASILMTWVQSKISGLVL
jgi:hypothetical protein